MQEEPRILPPEKLLQQVFCLSITRLYINMFQHRDNVHEQELSVTARRGCICGGGSRTLRVQEGEDTELAADEHAGAGLQVGGGGEVVGSEVAVAGMGIGAYVVGVQVVAVDVAAAQDGGVYLGWREGAAAGTWSRWKVVPGAMI